MPSQKNVHLLAEVKHNLEKSKALILGNHAKLSVSDQNSLRSKISQSGGVLMVAKNNLLRIALKDQLGEVPSEVDKALNGPTTVIFANEDAVTTTKALAEFVKDKELPEIKIGVMDGRVLSVQDIDTLSKLPSRNDLLSRLLAQLQAPAQAFVRQLNAPAQRLVYALEAIRSQK